MLKFVFLIALGIGCGVDAGSFRDDTPRGSASRYDTAVRPRPLASPFYNAPVAGHPAARLGAAKDILSELIPRHPWEKRPSGSPLASMLHHPTYRSSTIHAVVARPEASSLDPMLRTSPGASEPMASAVAAADRESAGEPLPANDQRPRTEAMAPAEAEPQTVAAPVLAPSTADLLPESESLELMPSADVALVDDAAPENQAMETAEPDSAPPPVKGTLWPECKSLRGQLAVCQQLETVRPWEPRLEAAIDQLESLASWEDPRLAAGLNELSEVAMELGRRATDAHSESAESLGRLAFELERRVRLWRLLGELAGSWEEKHRRAETAAQNISLRRWELASIPAAWREFLYLNELFAQGADPQTAARRTLARMYSQALDPGQRRAVEQWIPAARELELRTAAIEPVSAELLLRDLEAFHQQTNGRTAARLIDQFQNVYWSESAEDLQLAAALNQLYRNANLRVTLSAELLNQVLNDPGWLEAAPRQLVDEQLGAGRTRNSGPVHVDLIPDPTSWNLSFAAKGSLLNRAPGPRDGFVFQNFGPAEARGARRIAVSLDGSRGTAPAVESLPDVALSLANSPTRSDASALQPNNPATSPGPTIPRTRIRLRIQQRIEQEVEATLKTTREQLKQEFVQPLAALDLDPQPIEMSTTTQELTLRYRLAGMDQLAAYTPRPELPAGRLATLQVHESCLNNILARLDLADQAFDADGLRQQLQQRLPYLTADRPELATSDSRFLVHFAPYDPVRVDLVDGGVNLSLRFRQLQLDSQAEGWRNVTIRTRYQPELDGFHLRWVQVGGVTASSKSISRGEEIAIAGAFAALLKGEYRVPLLPSGWRELATPAQVVVEQLDVRDGWLSVVWNSAKSPESTSNGERVSETHRLRRRTFDR